LSARWSELGASEPEIMRTFRGFNAYAEAFRKESESHES
jgi:sulfhydrogenase subunit delta